MLADRVRMKVVMDSGIEIEMNLEEWSRIGGSGTLEEKIDHLYLSKSMSIRTKKKINFTNMNTLSIDWSGTFLLQAFVYVKLYDGGTLRHTIATEGIHSWKDGSSRFIYDCDVSSVIGEYYIEIELTTPANATLSVYNLYLD